MSGPKTNSLDVAARQRMMLASIRDSLVNATTNANRRLGTLKSECLSLASLAGSKLDEAEMLSILDIADRAIASASKVTVGSDLTAAQKAVDDVVGAMDSMLLDAERKLEPFLQNARALAHMHESAENDASFASDLAKIATTDASMLDDELDRLRHSSHNQDSSFQEDADRESAPDENGLTLPEAKARAKAQRDVFDELCIKARTMSQILEARGINAPLPDEFPSLEAVDSLLTKLEERLRESDRQEYIRACVDEAMRRHGYDVSRSVVLANAPQSDSLLFEASSAEASPTGRNTGIFATYVGDGDLMLQVVGLTEPDGETHAGGLHGEMRLDPAPCSMDDELLKSQQTFCSVYAEIKDDLAEMGIALSTKAETQPDRMYCRQLVDASDEESSSSTSSRSSENRALEQEKRRRASGAAMKMK